MKILFGYLYLADLNPRFGTEAGKVRPVVVLQTNLLNSTSHPSTIIAPCTTKLVGENPLRIEVEKNEVGNDEACEIMLDQIRAIDNKRFKKRLEQLPPKKIKELKLKIRDLLEL